VARVKSVGSPQRRLDLLDIERYMLGYLERFDDAGADRQRARIRAIEDGERIKVRQSDDVGLPHRLGPLWLEADNSITLIESESLAPGGGTNISPI
jgi:hypothetical protein